MQAHIQFGIQRWWSLHALAQGTFRPSAWRTLFARLAPPRLLSVNLPDDELAKSAVDSETEAELDEVASEAEAGDEIVLQQVMRIRTPEGRECVYATLRADFIPGQRYQALQVAFCPAFELLPTIEVETIEGPAATVKVLQATHHGAQFEVRLDAPIDGATHVTIEVAAYLQDAE